MYCFGYSTSSSPFTLKSSRCLKSFFKLRIFCKAGGYWPLQTQPPPSHFLLLATHSLLSFETFNILKIRTLPYLLWYTNLNLKQKETRVLDSLMCRHSGKLKYTYGSVPVWISFYSWFETMAVQFVKHTFPHSLGWFSVGLNVTKTMERAISESCKLRDLT